MERGRTIKRTPRVKSPLDRAESRRRKHDATLELDVHHIQPRLSRSSTLYEDPTDPCAALEDQLLEPCPQDSLSNSVSEIMESPVGSDQSRVDVRVPTVRFARTRSTSSQDLAPPPNKSTGTQTPLFPTNKALYSAPTLGPEVVQQLLPNISHDDYLSLKSSRQLWSSNPSQPPSLTIMAQLPAEILQQIYFELSPIDFNSARHVCRSWYISSLERSLLETMLKRGGWSSSIHEELASNHVIDWQVHVNDEWLMSKRIARECALGPNWTGNGFRPREDKPQSIVQEDNLRHSPFIQTSATDFTDHGVYYPGKEEPNSGIIFTVSTCAKFLMVAHGCLVSIYELNQSHKIDDDMDGKVSGDLRPVTSVICPRRVLACSMDTSSHRYAIAVLMDGRMGLVCDLTTMKNRSRRRSSVKYRKMHDSRRPSGKVHRNRVSISSSRTRGFSRTQAGLPFVFPVIAAEAPGPRPPVEFDSGAWQDRGRLDVFNDSINSGGQSPSPPYADSESTTFAFLFPMNVETSTPTIYSPLCTADDQPRSVALCPQRRCVAFGCSSGIELHWVDALTGQDLNRWFPLTAPSDHLYFLPPRAGVDSAKKLRLISSAGRAGEQSVIADRFNGSRNSRKAGERGGSSPFWGVLPERYSGGWIGLGAADSTSSGALGRDNSDHYRAVPLSDGYHILFTDPATGLLCLGSDAPVGGPTKLLRKIWFAGPKGQGSPVTYMAGSDLRYGVRIVAAYGQGAEHSIWLFSVPADVFTDSQSDEERLHTPFSSLRSGSEPTDREWTQWWPDTGLDETLETTYGDLPVTLLRKDRVWPLHVKGQEVGAARGLVDLAIDAGPDMTICAFCRDGVARAWQIDNGSPDARAMRELLVLRDGTIREVNANGDVEMCDSASPVPESPTSPTAEGQQTFDGAASMASSIIFGYQQFSGRAANSGQDAVNYDADGDVLMEDLPDAEERVSEYQSDESFEMVALARDQQREFLAGSSRAPSRAFIQSIGVDGHDLVDVLTGIARIEIEIR